MKLTLPPSLPSRAAPLRRGEGTSETRAEDDAGTSPKADAFESSSRSPIDPTHIGRPSSAKSRRPGITPTGFNPFDEAASTTPSEAEDPSSSHASSSTSGTTELPATHGDAATLESALALAVRENNLRRVEDALQRGADPKRIDDTRAGEDIRKTLKYARRTNKLYPSKGPSETETDLDRALRNGLNRAGRREAITLFIQEMKKRGLYPSNRKDLQQAWRDAPRENRTDLQRAILLLEADKNPDFRLLESHAPADKEVAQVMKEIPYHSPKRKAIDNALGACFFDRAEIDFDHEQLVEYTGILDEKKIQDRHFVEHRHAAQEQSQDLKFDYSQFAAGPNAIERNIRPETEADCNRAIYAASEVHLFDNRDFGKLLSGQLKSMEAKGETGQLIVLKSSHQTMGVDLKIKDKNGQRSYVARFYDPSKTTTHARAAFDNVQDLETMTLADFLGDTYSDYYAPSRRELSVMAVRPKAQKDQASQPLAHGLPENRTLTSHIPDGEINGEAMYHLMALGFAGNLRSLSKSDLARWSEGGLIGLLSAQSGDRRGLTQAMLSGHSDVVKTVFELLKLVPESRRAEVLRGSLSGALEGGQVDTAKLFVQEAFEHVPKGAACDLIGEALSSALRSRHAGAREAFTKVLEMVPENMRANAVAGGFDGASSLSSALTDGHADAVKAFAEVLKGVPKESWAEIAAAKSNVDPLSITDGSWTGMVAARNYKCPGLLSALGHGKADAIKAFGEILKLLPPETRVDLVAARLPDGTPGLSAALESGIAEAVRAYGELLKLVPEESRAELVAARDVDGIPQFITALSSPYADTIVAFGELLPLVPEKQRAKVLASDKLSKALKHAYPHVREAFEEIKRANVPRSSFPKIFKKLF